MSTGAWRAPTFPLALSLREQSTFGAAHPPAERRGPQAIAPSGARRDANAQWVR